MSERAHFGPTVAAFALAACSTLEPPPPVGEVTRSYQIAPGEAEHRIREVLQEAGFAPSEPADGLIRASVTYEDERDWAWCPPRRVKDRGSDRRQLARPVDWTSTVEARVTGDAGSSRVVVATDHAQTLRNGFINWTFDNACRSTGALERRVLDAIAAPA